MKRFCTLVLPLALALCAAAARPARADAVDANPDSLYLVGEFVDPVCIFQHGMYGKESKQCAMVRGRVEQGIWFLDIRRRKLYSVIGQNHWEDARAGFLESLGDTFAIRAKVWKREGSAAISVNAVYPWRQQPAASYAFWPWRLEWTVLLGCAVLGALHTLCLTRWRRRLGAPHDRFETGRSVTFLSGLVVVIVSLNGPLHELSDLYLFSTHMVQHLLLAQVFPLLFLLGMPGWLRQGLLRPALVRRPFDFLAGVPLGFILYSAVFSIWHFPVLYNLMMRDHSFHVVMHLMVMATATLMWWPVAGGRAVTKPLTPGAQMLYLFLLGTPMMVVAAMLVFAATPLYEWYRYAPPIWGMTPLEDQKLGALIMWVPGGLFFWGVMSVVYFRWSNREHRSEDPLEIPAAPQRT